MAIIQRAQRIAFDVWAASRVLKDASRFVPLAKWHAGRLLELNAEERPNSPALIYTRETFSWRELNLEANRYAAFFLRQGLRRGDVVALLMDNRPDFVFIELGLNKIGVISALINTQLGAEPLIHAINVTKPRRVIVGSEHAARLQAVAGQLPVAQRERGVLVVSDDSENVDDFPVVDPEVDVCPVENPRSAHWPSTGDAMGYLYTSGTTGLPKPAIISNQRFLMASCAFARIAHECGPGDVIYSALPLYHGSAQWAGLGAALYSGATLAIRRKFSATRFWEDVCAVGATHVLYIGELCRYLLNQPPQQFEREHKVRLCVGNGLRPDIWQAFQERFRIPLIREFYGATEGNAPLMNHEGRTGMVGTLRSGQALLRCDPETGEPLRNSHGFCERVSEGVPGLLVGRISRIFRFDGYLDERDTERKVIRDVFERGDRYFNSGDLLTLHADNWVSFTDRIGDTFRWKGENVSTNEVAEVLNRAPGVLESIVYGVSVPGRDGRAGMAILCTDPSFELEAFAHYVNERLAGYQRPQFVRLEASLRTTATLKHQKSEYRGEGFNPERVTSPLYFLRDGRYSAIDRDVHARIVSGELGPR